jgi:hypothetical protein
MASRSHYNTPAYRRSRLRASRLTDQGFAYEERACFLILNPSRDDVPPSLHPFLGEATTPDPRLISSPGGGVSPYSTLIPCFQRSALLAKPASAALATATHASVTGDAQVYGSKIRFETIGLDQP